MKLYVFTGPSLPPKFAQRHWREPVYLPPAAQGDVYKIARRKPWGIGIIDGLYERVPSVWHKEILWALSQGIAVYGSGSMGALRAAELAEFGMVGVGAIFATYAEKGMEDDDEVMRVHCGAARNYEPGSEAMINIRYTLATAVEQRVIQASTAETLTQIAKALFYPQRNYDRLVREGLANRLPAAELRRLKDWIPAGQIDQQRLDAIAMLDRMREDARRPLPPKQVHFSLQHTKYWALAMRRYGPRGR